MGRKRTLRGQFNLRLFIILISITILSGIVQFYLINQQVEDNVEREASMVSQSIEQGIAETDLASQAIERQIDYKLEVISERISDHLPNDVEDISTDQLKKLKEQMNITGIDIFAYDENETVSVVKTTEPDELGFTLKGISEEGYEDQVNLLSSSDFEFNIPGSYSNENLLVLFTAQSGSREEPQFFKYAYYHEPGTDYILNAFIEAEEVYKFTQEVGPDSWINNLLSEHKYAKEIAVLDPRVFADPSLEEAMYPPLQKVVNGTYTLETEEQVLIDMVENPQEVTRIDEHNGKKVYKMFIPYDNGRVIYVAMDYEEMSAPFTNYSLILIGFGFVSLIVLFLTTTQFFNNIYSNIAKIITQIKSLEKGDFTVHSDVNDAGELGDLSRSTNKMADTLNNVLGQTREQAIQTERHAYLLESEANNSVEKVYSMSMETTSDTREKTDEINYIFEQIEQILAEDNVKDQEIKSNLVKVQELVRNQSSSATEMTITLSDLMKSLHDQSASLSEISKKLLNNLEQFELNDGR